MAALAAFGVLDIATAEMNFTTKLSRTRTHDSHNRQSADDGFRNESLYNRLPTPTISGWIGDGTLGSRDADVPGVNSKITRGLRTAGTGIRTCRTGRATLLSPLVALRSVRGERSRDWSM